MAALMALCTYLFRSSLKYVFPRSKHNFLVERTPYGLPVPACVHQTITKEELDGRKLMVVGDVHGCFDELVELLDKCEGWGPDVCLVFVGDLINKGPKNAEVVQLVREMGAYCVRGNHDEVCLLGWQNYLEGRESLSPKLEWMKKLSGEELRWLFELPFTISIPSLSVCVVHAGLLPRLPLDQQSHDDMLHMRDVSYDPTLASWLSHKSAMEGTVPWASAWKGPPHVYFGHDAIRRLQVYSFATGLDTGCVYGGKLTAAFPLEGNRIVQVEAHCVHHKPGRRQQT